MIVFKILKKLFGTGGIRSVFGDFPINISDICKISFCLIDFFLEKKINKIFICRDTRESGKPIFDIIYSILSEKKFEIFDLGICTTACMANQILEKKGDFGIVITASHNDFKENGLKFFSSDARLINIQDEKILEKYFFDREILNLENSSKNKNLFHQDYFFFFKNIFQDKDFGRKKILIDFGNGASFIAEKLFKDLNLNCYFLGKKPNGKNINLKCGAVETTKLSEKVLEKNFDMGVAFDGDGDRIAIIDERGKKIEIDKIIGFLSREFQKENNLKNNKIVVTTYSNLALTNYLKKENIEVLLVENGERNVVDKMFEEDVSLGGEYSGHIVIKKFSTCGDGILVFLQLLYFLEKLKIKVSEIDEIFDLYPSVLKNIKVKEKVPFDKMPSLQENINFVKESLGNEGKLIIRYSGTENICRIYLEGKNFEKIENLGKLLEKNFQKIK